jgi:lysophospholipase L1-like esterase
MSICYDWRMRVLVFGDSITQGYWDTNGGWVDHLRNHYEGQQVQDLREHDEPTVFNLGISADTSDNILNRIVNETTARTRHNNLPIVIVQIGVNDSCIIAGKYQVPPEQYAQNLYEIVDKMRLLSSKLIFVGLTACNEVETTPVFWRNIHYTNGDIEKYEGTMRRIAKETHTPFIPLFAPFAAAFNENKDLLADGLHPNNRGHQVIYEIVRPALDELLV